VFLKSRENIIRFLFFLVIFLLLFFLGSIFFKSLNTTKIFVPDKLIGRSLPDFKAKSFNDKNKYFTKNEIFSEKKYYLLNIWASWCGPCREEHPILIKLSNDDNLEIVGLNFKDKKESALKFLDKNGNPYKKILIDNDGSVSINLGAYGVPETFLINEKKIIELKFVGPLKNGDYKKILKKINYENEN
tara:strand:+ start:229 stop:792 length:564 start_codon:yes stop_codon:yes gene_type:complete